MRIKAVSSLVGGEVLAEPILTEKNDILIPNGTRIKPDYVPLIESLGIESVMVEDPYENYESPNSIVDPAIFDKYVKKVRRLMESHIYHDGRGIPVGTNHKAKKSALEVVFTVLHAGGKFGGGGYKVSGGLHGVGASVVNALSTWLTVEVYKDGNIYRQSYKRGKTDDTVKIVGQCDESLHGTKVHFLPSRSGEG